MPVSSNVNFGTARAAVRSSRTQALQHAGEVGLDASNDLIPVLSGEMRDTGRVTSEGGRAAVAYRHPGAALQHENLGFEHPGGGQPKFLEQGMVSARAEMARAMQARMAREFKGGTKAGKPGKPS